MQSHSPNSQHSHKVIGLRKETDNDEFQDFKCHLFHGCLKIILCKLGRYIAEWDLARCANNHFHCVVYGTGPYITDYPEQVLVAEIAYSWCPTYINLPVWTLIILSHSSSCDANPTNLDDASTEPQTLEKTENLLQTKSADKLWYQHGLIHDFHVHLIHVWGQIQLSHP